MWSFVFQTAKEASVDGKRAVTAEAEVNLWCFVVRILSTFCSWCVNCICFVGHFNSQLSPKSH